MRPLRVLAVWSLALCMLSPLSPSLETPQQRFSRWQREHAAQVAAYQHALNAQNVGEVAPMASLLRTSRRWRACHAPEFAVPPPSHWAAMVPTLALLRQLEQADLLDAQHIRSGWRDAQVNACSGGSVRSQHLRNAALDLDLDTRITPARLCAYWRQYGPPLRMGLGFYSPERIHIDTAGFRSWGHDHTWRTSLCTQEAAPATRTTPPPAMPARLSAGTHRAGR